MDRICGSGNLILEVARAAAVELDFQKLTLFSNVLAAMPVGKPPSNENQDRLLAIFNDLDNASNEADKNALARTRNALASTRIDGPLPKAVHDQLLEDFPTLPSLAKALATMPLGQPLPERIHDQLLADQRQAIEKQEMKRVLRVSVAPAQHNGVVVRRHQSARLDHAASRSAGHRTRDRRI